MTASTRTSSMRRRNKPTPAKLDAITRFAHRLENEVHLQHHAYIPGVGALSGRLTASPGRSIQKRLSLLVDRHIFFSLQRVTKDFSIHLDYDDDAPAEAPPTAIVMQRLDDTATIALGWTRSRLSIGATVVNFNATTAGEDLVEAICVQVATHFLSGR